MMVQKAKIAPKNDSENSYIEYALEPILINRFIELDEDLYLQILDSSQILRFRLNGIFDESDVNKSNCMRPSSMRFFIIIENEINACDFIGNLCNEFTLYAIDKVISECVTFKKVNNQKVNDILKNDLDRKRPCLCCKNFLKNKCSMSYRKQTKLNRLEKRHKRKPTQANLYELIIFETSVIANCQGSKLGMDAICFTVTQERSCSSSNVMEDFS